MYFISIFYLLSVSLATSQQKAFSWAMFLPGNPIACFLERMSKCHADALLQLLQSHSHCSSHWETDWFPVGNGLVPTVTSGLPLRRPQNNLLKRDQ